MAENLHGEPVHPAGDVGDRGGHPAGDTAVRNTKRIEKLRYDRAVDRKVGILLTINSKPGVVDPYDPRQSVEQRTAAVARIYRRRMLQVVDVIGDALKRRYDPGRHLRFVRQHIAEGKSRGGPTGPPRR